MEWRRDLWPVDCNTYVTEIFQITFFDLLLIHYDLKIYKNTVFIFLFFISVLHHTKNKTKNMLKHRKHNLIVFRGLLQLLFKKIVLMNSGCLL